MVRIAVRRNNWRVNMKVDEHVRFLGKQDHMERLIPRMHALHLPSETEAFGLAALEAMACGVPPVATLDGWPAGSDYA